MTTGKHYIVEPTGDGEFKGTAKGAKRASVVAPTQKKVIAAVKAFNPDDHPDVARVRKVETGKPDQFRAVQKKKK
jgi:hypothetical protein